MDEEADGGAPADRRLAGFWRRLLGWSIDHLLILAFFLPAARVLLAGPRTTVGCHLDLDKHLTGLGNANASCKGPTDTTWALAGWLTFLAVIAALAYQAFLAGGPRGQTLGMRVVGTRLVDADSGEPVGELMAVVRYVFGVTISTWLFWFGYLWTLWDGRRQTWHDKLTSAVVVRA